MAIYNIHGGHSLICRGASGLLDEVTEDRKVKDKVIELLRNAGHTVYDCTDDSGKTQSQNLKNIVTKCNEHSAALDISIHLNAGGGTGTEVWIYSSKNAEVASRIAVNIATALGIKNRGVKISSSLYVLKRTKAPAVLVECCFVDSEIDKNAWNVDECSKAIVEGILNITITEPAKSTSNPQPVKTKDEIEVDGVWGKATTKKAQQVFGTVVDGKVSRQKYTCKKYLQNASTLSWEFKTENFGNGSALIRAIQNKIGATPDGLFGPNSVKKLQTFLGVSVDGYMGAETVKAFQRWLNAH